MGLLNIIPGWKYISAGVGIVVLVVAVYFVVDRWIIGPKDLHSAEERAMEHACELLIERLHVHLKSIDRRYMTIALPDVRNDTSGGQVYFTLKDRIDSDPMLRTPNEGTIENIKADVSSWVSSDDPPPSPEKLLEDRSEIHGVLLVEVISRKPTFKYARMELKAQLHEWQYDGEERDGTRSVDMEVVGVVDFDTNEVVDPNADAEEEAAEEENLYGFGWASWRILLALISVLGVPFAFLPMTDFVTKRGNNAIGFLYLVGIVFVSMLPWLFLLILSRESAPWGYWLLGAGLGAGGFLWSYKMHDAWSERI